jgi:hypothetical protein
VEVNGREVAAAWREGTGQMLIPVGAGVNQVRVTFIPTWDRKLGALTSAVALLLVIYVLASRRFVSVTIDSVV